MIKIYGIKTCGSVRKAIKFFKENSIEFELIDFKKTTVAEGEITSWLKKYRLTYFLTIEEQNIEP